MTICLNMIVRNEANVVKRCFDSLMPFITTWVIVDTGSTDGTQEVIENYFKEKGILGELHERPWIDFATDRNFALTLAEGKADYALFIDADEILHYYPNFTKPTLDTDFYYIVAESGGLAFLRPFLAKTSIGWKWEGAVHETLVLQDPTLVTTRATFPNLALVSYPDGNRRLNPKKFHNDVEMLKKAHKKDPKNSRHLFYLGKSCLGNRQLKAAIYYLKKMIHEYPLCEETFSCWKDLGLIYLMQNKPIEKIVKLYEEAADLFPHKMEPYYLLANLHRKKKKYQKAFEYAEKGIEKSSDHVGYFIDKWIYQHGMLLEYMLAAYALGKGELGKKAGERILARKDLIQNIRNLVERTIRALEKGDMTPINTVK